MDLRLRLTVTGKLHLIERQTALRTPIANYTRASQRATIIFWMIRNIEFRARVCLQSLLAVPGHVLQSGERAIGGEDIIQVADSDNGVVRRLDHVLQGPVSRGARRSVAQILVVAGSAENVGGCALIPIRGWRMDGFLHIAAVEVDYLGRRYVVSWVDASSHTPRVRAGFGNMVDVEAGIDFEERVVHVVEYVAGVVGGVVRVGQDWERGGWRGKLKVFLEVGAVATGILFGVNRVQEGAVEEEQLRPVIHKRYDDGLFLKRVIPNDRIVNSYTSEIVVDRVIRVDECVGDVRHVVSTITLTSQVYLSVLDLKCVDEALVETDELLTELHFVRDVRYPLCITNTDWLLNPHHVGQVDPCVGVLSRGNCARFPSKRAIFGQQTRKRTAAWAAVEPGEKY